MTSILKIASISQIKRTAGRNAFYAGSSPLGINIDNSDIDIMIPYKRESSYLKAVERARTRYPELKERASSLDKTNKTVFTGRVNGKDVDLVYAHGEKAQNFASAYHKAKNGLSPEKAAKIRDKKNKLKSSWFFPEHRYKRYKNQVADDLGLRKHYF